MRRTGVNAPFVPERRRLRAAADAGHPCSANALLRQQRSSPLPTQHLMPTLQTSPHPTEDKACVGCPRKRRLHAHQHALAGGGAPLPPCTPSGQGAFAPLRHPSTRPRSALSACPARPVAGRAAHRQKGLAPLDSRVRAFRRPDNHDQPFAVWIPPALRGAGLASWRNTWEHRVAEVRHGDASAA